MGSILLFILMESILLFEFWFTLEQVGGHNEWFSVPWPPKMKSLFLVILKFQSKEHIHNERNPPPRYSEISLMWNFVKRGWTVPCNNKFIFRKLEVYMKRSWKKLNNLRGYLYNCANKLILQKGKSFTKTNFLQLYLKKIWSVTKGVLLPYDFTWNSQAYNHTCFQQTIIMLLIYTIYGFKAVSGTPLHRRIRLGVP